MSTYVIGDVQGCYTQLQQLLQKINYQAGSDQLWFTGDLVGRGPQPLQCLRFISSLYPQPIVTLGNHDLHFLAIVHGLQTAKPEDKFDELLMAEDKMQLADWLRKQPLLHYDETFDMTLTHAGIYPLWDLSQAKSLAKELENNLRSETFKLFLQTMYGDEPTVWHELLQGEQRLRFICNAFTRMRYCDMEGHLDLSEKGPLGSAPNHLLPWFRHPHRRTEQDALIFGHWASLEAKADTDNIYPVDGGCVWGNQLCTIRLDDMSRFAVGC